MAILENAISIDAPPGTVWAVLGRLDALHEYDPGVARSEVTSAERSGVGASRRCELRPRGWFRERVTVWEPDRALAFELVECTLPVRRLRHHYTLTEEGAMTRVAQRMEYRLKLGPIGALLDLLFVRRRWNAGIQAFLAGLKRAAEQAPPSRTAAVTATV